MKKQNSTSPAVNKFLFTLCCTAVLLVIGACSHLNAQVPAAEQTWAVHYDGGSGTDSVNAMVVDAQGYIYVTGWSEGSGSGTDYVTVKYNRSGSQEWAVRFNGTENGDDVPYSIAVDAVGNVYVTGASATGINDAEYLTIKYDHNGTMLWSAAYEGISIDIATSVAVDASGNVFVTGGSRAGSNFNFDYLTIKYDSDGNQLWTDRYDGSSPDFTGEDIALDLKVDAAGNAYITGRSALFFVANAVTIKYAPDGTRDWVQSFDGQGSDYREGIALALDSDGNTYMTGSSGLFYSEISTLKYASDGSQLWLKYYQGPEFGNSAGLDITLDDSGYVYLTGFSYQDTITGYDYATIKYTPAGDKVWDKLYNGTGSKTDEALAIAADGESNVYVTGASTNPAGNYDYATVKYDYSGKQKWAARFNGTGNGRDEAVAVALDDSGNVIVAGHSYSTGTGYDFVTIKYKQIFIPVPDALQDAVDSVQSLPLGAGNKNALTSKLKNAIAKYNAGDYNAAKNILYAFINQLNQFVADGALTQAQAQPLIDYAMSIIDAINSLLPKAADNSIQGTPSEFSLSQNFPNPFNPATNINYSIPSAGYVQLKVYDILGREVAALVNGNRQAGNYQVTFDGSKLASGLYIYKLTSGNYIETKKMLMIK